MNPFAGALCAEVDPDLMFPEKGSNGGALAKSICARCDVAEACLEYALTHADGYFGVWGGTSVMERRAIRAERNIVVEDGPDVDQALGLLSDDAIAMRRYRASLEGAA